LPVSNKIDSAIEQLQSGTREARKSAAIKLGRIRDPKSIPFLLQAIREDSYPMTRVFAIQSLTWIADQSVVPDLIEIVRADQDDLVRVTAIEALVSFKSKVSLGALYEVSYNFQNSNKILTAASKAIGLIEGYSA